METNDATVTKQKWYSIREAAEYLDVGEPTLYRWMREGKITYRKVGDSRQHHDEYKNNESQSFLCIFRNRLLKRFYSVTYSFNPRHRRASARKSPQKKPSDSGLLC